MKKWVFAIFLAAAVMGCQRYQPPSDGLKSQSGLKTQDERKLKARKEQKSRSEELVQKFSDPVKVKGIYLSAYTAGSAAEMDKILVQLDATELNAVVIDVKDDNGIVTFSMDSPLVQEIGSSSGYIPDIKALTKNLKEHGIYLIARIPAFRDPYLAEAKPEWCCKKADGTVYRDKNNLAWVNPYKKEVWEYLIEIAQQAGEAGFDEIQFDYIRFGTEKGMNEVIFDQADTKGKSRQEIILEFTEYACRQLRRKGLYVSADVFGAVIFGREDAEAVGQDYEKMAGKLDAICPMVYPSHYGNGNFGIAYPDMEPYETVFNALSGSKVALSQTEREPSALVRPWLQDFTASYLSHYIPYGPIEVREQIQAVYDAGYEQWILWNASGKYHYEGLLTAEEAEDGDRMEGQARRDPEEKE
ncbi:MAG: putative glycoside hydrolase [Lachnospiraceae bacterium]|nr:putative glycoside hydrolase [Lachnospiraceae bacterium]